MTVTYSTGNLIVNPGAELGPGAQNFASTVIPDGWTTIAGFTAIAYKIGGSSDLNAAAGRKLQGGSNYLAGGPGSGSAQAAQTVDVSGHAAAIDAGGILMKLSGQFGGFLNQEDSMSLTAIFFGDGGANLGSATIGAVTAAERSNLTNLLGRFDALEVAAGTRSIEIQLVAIRSSGSFNDGYGDNFGLELVGLGGGFVHVAGTMNFAREAIGPSAGISFDPQFKSTATFNSNQFGANGIALNATIAGSFVNDRLVIKVANGESFSGQAFDFSNWTNGKDRVTLEGRGGDETITGTRMDDTILGGGGNDTLRGGAGRDTLDGGAGRDTLTGGQGKDKFVLANLAADRDIIRDFAPGMDTLIVSAALFGGGLAEDSDLASLFAANAGGQAVTGKDRFLYDTNNGRLYFDEDGNGAAARVLIATLTGAPALSASDFDILA